MLHSTVRRSLAFAASLAVVVCAATVHAVPKVGRQAPAFEGRGADGKMHKLSKYKGKYVVLEWLNHGCPFVKKHYGSNNMQVLQKKWTKKGVVWLSVGGAVGRCSGNRNSQFLPYTYR